MRSARKALCGAIALLAPVIFVMQGNAEDSTSPTIPPAPLPSAVFEFKISRTTEPLSLFNMFPPPLSLDEVMRLKGEQTTSESAVARLKNKSGIKLPGVTGARASTGTTPSAPLPPGLTAARLTPRVSPPSFREYRDTIVLTNGSSLSCRVLSDVGAALRVELSNGAVVHMPKQRIATINGKALPR